MLNDLELGTRCCFTTWTESYPLKNITAKTDGQLNDSIIRIVLGWKESDSKPKWDDISHMCLTVKHYWSQWDRLKIIKGVLYREWYKTQGGPLPINWYCLRYGVPKY